MSKVAPHFVAILDLVAGGLAIEAALRSRAEFPIKATWKSYAYDNRFPDRRQRLETAQAEGKGKQRYKFQRFSDKDYGRSLALIAANVGTPIADLDFDGMPGYTGLIARAKSDPAFATRFTVARAGRKHGGKAKVYNETHYAEALTIIKRDGLNAYKASRAGLPSHSAIWKTSLRDANFAADYRAAGMVVSDRRRRQRRANADQYRIEMARVRRLGAGAKARVGELFEQMLQANDLYARVSRCVTKNLDDADRRDVISDIIEAVLNHEIDESEIEEAAADFVADHRHEFSAAKHISISDTFDGGSILDDMLTSDWSCEGAI